MSKCISMAGEYSEHTPDGDHICQQCFALDEDALFAELAGLRAAVSRVRELHKPWERPGSDLLWCSHCIYVWPCSTAEALGDV